MRERRPYLFVKNSTTKVGKGVEPDDSGAFEFGVAVEDVFKSAVSFAYRLS